MRYLSLFSGVEAATLAFAPLGWECVAVAEIEPFPCSLLAHYYPNVPNLGDVTRISEADIAALGPVDLIVFGSPCQDLSVAGKGSDLAGKRSGLFHDAIRIVDYARKHCGLRWAVWENVPGAFSSNKGLDFAVVVGALAGADYAVPPKGWGNEGAALGEKGMVEWSTLDAQWFGVAQRRRRVFAVADFGDWAGRFPVLLEAESLRGDSAPRREAGQGCAGTLEARTNGGGFPGTDGALAGHVVVSPAVTAKWAKGTGGPSGDECQNLVAFDSRQNLASGEVPGPLGAGSPQAQAVCIQAAALRTNPASGPDGAGFRADGPAYTLEARAEVQAVCFKASHYTRGKDGAPAEATPPLSADADRGDQDTIISDGLVVRRLTPRECERLQGFPDDYTLVPHKGKSAADTPRYRAIGNSMAVPVMRWIGQRIGDVSLV